MAFPITGGMSNNLASIHNCILHASYTLTLPEKRLLLAAISTIHPQDDLTEEGFDVSRVKVRDYAELYSMSPSEARREMRASVELLFDRYISLGENERFRWVGKVGFHVDIAELYWWKDLIPFISLLQKDFTQIRLLYISGLTSFYHVRIYEWLLSNRKKFRHKKEFNMGLGELKIMLNLAEDSVYRNFGKVNERIVKPAVKAINAKTDLDVEVVLKKEGRRVVGLGWRVELLRGR